MENNNSAHKARTLVSRISLEPNISGYLSQMLREIPALFMHSVDVAYLACEVAYELDLDYAEDIARGALLHDIGKLHVPAGLLLAARRLTPHELEILKSHSALGYEMIRTDDTLSDIVKDIIKNHHEKQDGSGYPAGLRAADLRKATKIVTVCDIYAAMTDQRPYHPPFKAYEALNIMAGEPIDKSILKVLKECPDR